jgi:hypothetical protein
MDMATATVEMDLDVTHYVRDETAEDGTKRRMICDLEVHPLAAEFEIMQGDRLRELVESIRDNGLRVPIKLDGDGRIIDGQNRAVACAILGKIPEFETASEDDVRLCVIDMNLNRRDLDPAARAILVARLSGGDVQKREKIAGQAGVSSRAVRQAAKVLKDGVPELQAAVSAGDVTLQDAEQLAQMPAEKQAEVLSSFGDEQKDRNRGNASVEAAVKGHKEKKRAEKPISFESWEKGAASSISKLILRAPEDLRDRAKRAIGNIVNATIRVQYEDASPDSFEADILDAEELLSRVEKLVKELPKSDRKEAEKLLGEKYAVAPPAIKKAEDAMAAIEAIRAGMSQAEQKKLAKLLGEPKPAPEPEVEYPEDPSKACDRFKRDVAAACKGMTGVKFPDKDDQALVLKAVGKAETEIGKMLAKTKALEDSKEVVFPEHLQSDAFRRLWDRWLQTRRIAGKYPTCDIQNCQLNKLAHFDLAQATEIVEKAVESEWQGIPVYSQLATTKWCGRSPAFPPAGAQEFTPFRNGNGKPAVDRSTYGKFDPTHTPSESDWK